VVLLNTAPDGQRVRYQKGDEVYAVYPETTSFYPATVTQPPRQRTSGPGEVTRVGVQFQDDSDDSGHTPLRWVAVHHVFKLS
jgi:hypothetical protein